MGTVILLRPYAPSATLRQMAHARHVEAVTLLDGGDVEGWIRLVKDAHRIYREARRAERHEEECRLAARALAALLDRAAGLDAKGKLDAG